jgi:hypothetical protein
VNRQLAFRLDPLVAFYQVDVKTEAVPLLIEWRHDLHLNGETSIRPFWKIAFVMEDRGRPAGVVVLASTINASVCKDEGLHRYNTVDIARICRNPDRRDDKCLRAVLRITREYLVPVVLEQDYPRWRARSAEAAGRAWPRIDGVSANSMPGKHDGDLYRFDGFRHVRTSKGAKGGGRQNPSKAEQIADGNRGLWVYRYPDPLM